MYKIIRNTLATLALLTSAGLYADDIKVFNLSCNDGVFTPASLTVPADTKFKLVVTNDGKSAEEFESIELNQEKIIAPGKKATMFIGPLPKGTYTFIGEFHPPSKGVIIAQ